MEDWGKQEKYKAKSNASITRGKGSREYVIHGFSPDLSALKG